MTPLLWIILCNWVAAWLISWVYVGWLWKVSGDVRFEGWVKLLGFIPVARFLLISRKSWYARQWERFYGFAAFGVMIHRDEPGQRDDDQVEATIVHEARHNLQALIWGLFFGIAYGVCHLVVGYDRNPFEVDARTATGNWILCGRPRILGFGERR